jgi:Type II secretion system (T2SS), protein M subtype b
MNEMESHRVLAAKLLAALVLCAVMLFLFTSTIKKDSDLLVAKIENSALQQVETGEVPALKANRPPPPLLRSPDEVALADFVNAVTTLSVQLNLQLSSVTVLQPAQQSSNAGPAKVTMVVKGPYAALKQWLSMLLAQRAGLLVSQFKLTGGNPPEDAVVMDVQFSLFSQ